MRTLYTINSGNHIKSYEFPDGFLDEFLDDFYEPIDIEEEEINYEENL